MLNYVHITLLVYYVYYCFKYFIFQILKLFVNKHIDCFINIENSTISFQQKQRKCWEIVNSFQCSLFPSVVSVFYLWVRLSWINSLGKIIRFNFLPGCRQIALMKFKQVSMLGRNGRKCVCRITDTWPWWQGPAAETLWNARRHFIHSLCIVLKTKKNVETLFF
jgi:hypothetical protein